MTTLPGLNIPRSLAIEMGWRRAIGEGCGNSDHVSVLALDGHSLVGGRSRPKRSVSTIVHILNDLLGATPPHPRVGPFGNSRSTSYCRNMDTSRINDSSRFDEEKEAIRGKVQHLQMMMEERRRRRQARRHHRAAPYPSPERPDLESSEAPPSGGMPDCASGPTSYPPEASRQRLLQDMDLV
ncbi:hypothetical protein LSH36_218g03061 [Paralvinella palmiformis]|uniref:Uncharacterized protein n=1 Tax=Paralvinella palmiformis TaxID=53620 RepID=A0AAD9JPI2_9ANNE|nr:hypothetical protein LSH36_218g03061 [Paralvinella palmiformis]